MQKLKRAGLTLLIGLGLSAGLLWPVLAAGEDGVRDNITPTSVIVTGTTRTLAAASGDGHEFINNEKTWVEITNSYSGTITATFVTPAQIGGLDVADVDVAIAAGVTRMVGPFPSGLFNQQSGTDRGKVYLNWNTAVTGTVANSVTLNVYKLP